MLMWLRFWDAHLILNQKKDLKRLAEQVCFLKGTDSLKTHNNTKEILQNEAIKNGEMTQKKTLNIKYKHNCDGVSFIKNKQVYHLVLRSFSLAFSCCSATSLLSLPCTAITEYPEIIHNSHIHNTIICDS